MILHQQLDPQRSLSPVAYKVIVFSCVLDSIMADSSASYIHMHLIEKCLIFHMTKEDCMEALSKHANIEPVITSTVWNELEKENKEFFEAYAKSKGKDDRMSEEETSQMIQKMISQSSNDSDD
ncbi:uncharacterized protein LOC110618828 isoform X1 [Manihot esculenta]|uniref:Uncharacterized protein n=1 Tax=Manihot esculenta TaxID=3983 RepID=A0A2C9VLV3_MANES|nr:uncharacterized protein LOC110618828 isoform X1 [Manihot esculenta]OAY46017.1 hypothetical protein MANES_07G110100v8 [Manihot esculenta]